MRQNIPRKPQRRKAKSAEKYSDLRQLLMNANIHLVQALASLSAAYKLLDYDNDDPIAVYRLALIETETRWNSEALDRLLAASWDARVTF